LTYFLLGAFALISQTMILREFFVVAYGNEFIFGILLTNWLVGIFIGAMAGGAVSERSKNNLMVFVGSILAMCILLPLSITLIRFLYAVSGTPAGAYIGFFKVFLYSACFIIPFSFFIGFVFPIAAKVQVHPSPINPGNSSSKEETVKGISQIYIFEALGALLSGIVYTFFMAGRLNAYFIAALVTLPLVVCAAALLRKARYHKTLVAAGILLVLNFIACLPPVNNVFETYTVEKRWHSVSTLSLTYSTDSRYQNVAVASLLSQHNLYLNTMFAQVFPNDEDNRLMAAQLVCQHPAPGRILVIGDAVSGLAKFLLRYNVNKVISVEIDAATVTTILKFLPDDDKGVLEDDRFRIVIKDGRQFVKDFIYEIANGKNNRDKRFDMVYINVSEPSTLLLNRYYTEEFFTDLAQIMPPNGVIALKITSSENYEKGIVTDYTSSVYNTVKAVFPEVVVTPGTENFIFASKAAGIVSDDPELLARRYEATGVKPRRLGLIFQSAFPAEKTRFIKTALQNNRSTRVNTDETPIACLYFNKIIGWYGQSNVAGLLGFFEQVKLGDVTLVIMVLFLFRLLYVSVRVHKNPGAAARVLRFHTLLAVFAAGMAGLSMELVILYTFQGSFGNIYHIIGFIIALFMFGLPLGAVASNRLMTLKMFSSQNRLVILIGFIQVVIAGISVVLPVTMNLFSKAPAVNQAIIFCATMLIGFAIGLIFPLAIHIYLGRGEQTGKTAGVVDAFDHFGAAVGAFFIGTLFLPVIGVEKVCRLVALFPLVVSILLFIDVGRSHFKRFRKKA
jgi:spermidine synthase